MTIVLLSPDLYFPASFLHFSAPSCLPHSYRNAFTGFILAARKLCQLTVISAESNASRPPEKNIHAFIFIWFEKFFSQWLIINQEIGNEMTKAINTSAINSEFIINRILRRLAPLTFLMPISFVLCLVMRLLIDQSPMQEISIAISVKIDNSFCCLNSCL